MSAPPSEVITGARFGGTTATAGPNSDASPCVPTARSTTATALTTWPTLTATPRSVVAKPALPLASVLMVVAPSQTAPGPWPLAWALAALKNSMR